MGSAFDDTNEEEEETVDVILNGELQEVIEAFEAEEFNAEWQSTENAVYKRLQFHLQPGSRLLHVATQARNDALHKVQYFIEQGIEVDITNEHNSTPLHMSALSNRVDLVRFLIENDADIEAEDVCGIRPLHHAARSGRTEAFVCLVTYGADSSAVSYRGETPLHYSALSGCMQIVRGLVESNADIHVRTNYQETVLHWAARGGQRVVLSYLIAMGVDVNGANQACEVPLHFAAFSNDAAVVELLLNKQADPEVRNEMNEVPLHRVFAGPQGEGLALVPQLLIGTGKGLTLSDAAGNTPISLAQNRGWSKTIQFLVDAGATEDAIEDDRARVQWDDHPKKQEPTIDPILQSKFDELVPAHRRHLSSDDDDTQSTYSCGSAPGSMPCSPTHSSLAPPTHSSLSAKKVEL